MRDSSTGGTNFELTKVDHCFNKTRHLETSMKSSFNAPVANQYYRYFPKILYINFQMYG